MSSGGGGGTTTEQTIPSWMQTYIGDNYQKAQQVASNPYTPYQGQGVAPMNSMEQAGQNQMYQMGANNTGMASANQGVQDAASAGSYTPQQVSYNAPTATQIQQQLSPYTSSVIDATNQQMNQQLQIEQQQEAGNATAAGAFGGSREGVQQALNQSYANQNMANADASLLNTGYQNAETQANTNAAGQYQAALANQSAGLQGNAQQLQAGVDLGALGQGQQSIASQNANDMYAAGQQSQNYQQQLDTYNQNLYNTAQSAGGRQLQDLESGTYNGTVGGTTTQSGNSGGGLASDLGMGASVAGILGSTGLGSSIGSGALSLLALL
jgi:hypothetical protein